MRTAHLMVDLLRAQRGGGQGAPGALAPFSDFGAVAPTFGRVGSFLRSIEQEMDQMLQVCVWDCCELLRLAML